VSFLSGYLFQPGHLFHGFPGDLFDSFFGRLVTLPHHVDSSVVVGGEPRRWLVDWIHCVFKSRKGAGYASRHCHMSCSPEPSLPAKMGSSTATCLVALNLASLPRWLWSYDVFHGKGPRQPTQEGSGGATCPMASRLTSLPRRAPVLPHVPWL
jgi:hypothetical protein